MGVPARIWTRSVSYWPSVDQLEDGGMGQRVALAFFMLISSVTDV
jgi:hypothetical protein